MDVSNLTERFTKKLGPLPVWAWAAIILGAGYVLYRVTVGGGGNRAAAETSETEGYATDSATDSAASEYATDTGSSLGSSGGGGYSPASATVPDYYSPGYDDSASIGLGSYGADNPLPVIISGIDPNLYTPSVTQATTVGVAASSGPSAADVIPAATVPGAFQYAAQQAQAAAAKAANDAAAVAAAIARAKTQAVQQVNEARAAEAAAAEAARNANTKKEKAAAAAAAKEAERQREQAQKAIASSKKIQATR